MACRVFAVLNSFWNIDNCPRNVFPFLPVFPVKMQFKFPTGATPFKVGCEIGVWCLMTSLQEGTKAILLSCRSVVYLLRPFEKEIFSYSMDYKSSFLKWRHGLTRPRALLGLIARAWRAWLQQEIWTTFSPGKRVRTFKKIWDSYLCIRNYSNLQKPYRPYRHFNFWVWSDRACMLNNTSFSFIHQA